MKTSELEGAALDWEVAKLEHLVYDGERDLFEEDWIDGDYQFTFDWEQGGPIIEREKIDVMWSGDRWSAYCMTPDGEQQLVDEGPTPLIAAMRVYVASKLGDEVDVPDGVI